MENTVPTEEQQNKENKGRGLIIILFVVIALLGFLSAYLFVQVNTLKKESEGLKNLCIIFKRK